MNWLEKKCCKCKTKYPVRSEEYLSKYFRRNPCGKYGFTSRCKQCEKKR